MFYKVENKMHNPSKSKGNKIIAIFILLTFCFTQLGLAAPLDIYKVKADKLRELQPDKSGVAAAIGLEMNPNAIKAKAGAAGIGTDNPAKFAEICEAIRAKRGQLAVVQKNGSGYITFDEIVFVGNEEVSVRTYYPKVDPAALPARSRPMPIYYSLYNFMGEPAAAKEYLANNKQATAVAVAAAVGTKAQARAIGSFTELARQFSRDRDYKYSGGDIIRFNMEEGGICSLKVTRGLNQANIKVKELGGAEGDAMIAMHMIASVEGKRNRTITRIAPKEIPISDQEFQRLINAFQYAFEHADIANPGIRGSLIIDMSDFLAYLVSDYGVRPYTENLEEEPPAGKTAQAAGILDLRDFSSLALTYLATGAERAGLRSIRESASRLVNDRSRGNAFMYKEGEFDVDPLDLEKAFNALELSERSVIVVELERTISNWEPVNYGRSLAKKITIYNAFLDKLRTQLPAANAVSVQAGAAGTIKFKWFKQDIEATVTDDGVYFYYNPGTIDGVEGYRKHVYISLGAKERDPLSPAFGYVTMKLGYGATPFENSASVKGISKSDLSMLSTFLWRSGNALLQTLATQLWTMRSTDTTVPLASALSGADRDWLAERTTWKVTYYPNGEVRISDLITAITGMGTESNIPIKGMVAVDSNNIVVTNFKPPKVVPSVAEEPVAIQPGIPSAFRNYLGLPTSPKYRGTRTVFYAGQQDEDTPFSFTGIQVEAGYKAGTISWDGKSLTLFDVNAIDAALRARKIFDVENAPVAVSVYNHLGKKESFNEEQLFLAILEKRVIYDQNITINSSSDGGFVFVSPAQAGAAGEAMRQRIIDIVQSPQFTTEQKAGVISLILAVARKNVLGPDVNLIPLTDDLLGQTDFVDIMMQSGRYANFWQSFPDQVALKRALLTTVSEAFRDDANARSFYNGTVIGLLTMNQDTFNVARQLTARPVAAQRETITSDDVKTIYNNAIKQQLERFGIGTFVNIKLKPGAALVDDAYPKVAILQINEDSVIVRDGEFNETIPFENIVSVARVQARAAGEWVKDVDNFVKEYNKIVNRFKISSWAPGLEGIENALKDKNVAEARRILETAMSQLKEKLTNDVSKSIHIRVLDFALVTALRYLPDSPESKAAVAKRVILSINAAIGPINDSQKKDLFTACLVAVEEARKVLSVNNPDLSAAKLHLDRALTLLKDVTLPELSLSGSAEEQAIATVQYQSGLQIVNLNKQHFRDMISRAITIIDESGAVAAGAVGARAGAGGATNVVAGALGDAVKQRLEVRRDERNLLTIYGDFKSTAPWKRYESALAEYYDFIRYLELKFFVEQGFMTAENSSGTVHLYKPTSSAQIRQLKEEYGNLVTKLSNELQLDSTVFDSELERQARFDALNKAKLDLSGLLHIPVPAVKTPVNPAITAVAAVHAGAVGMNAKQVGEKLEQLKRFQDANPAEPFAARISIVIKGANRRVLERLIISELDTDIGMVKVKILPVNSSEESGYTNLGFNEIEFVGLPQDVNEYIYGLEEKATALAEVKAKYTPFIGKENVTIMTNDGKRINGSTIENVTDKAVIVASANRQRGISLGRIRFVGTSEEADAIMRADRELAMHRQTMQVAFEAFEVGSEVSIINSSGEKIDGLRYKGIENGNAVLYRPGARNPNVIGLEDIKFVGGSEGAFKFLSDEAAKIIITAGTNRLITVLMRDGRVLDLIIGTAGEGENVFTYTDPLDVSAQPKTMHFNQLAFAGTSEQVAKYLSMVRLRAVGRTIFVVTNQTDTIVVESEIRQQAEGHITFNDNLVITVAMSPDDIAAVMTSLEKAHTDKILLYMPGAPNLTKEILAVAAAAGFAPYVLPDNKSQWKEMLLQSV